MFEDLKGYCPKKGDTFVSQKANWLRGIFPENIRELTNLRGFKPRFIPAYYTSQLIWSTGERGERGYHVKLGTRRTTLRGFEIKNFGGTASAGRYFSDREQYLLDSEESLDAKWNNQENSPEITAIIQQEQDRFAAELPPALFHRIRGDFGQQKISRRSVVILRSRQR